MKTQQTPEESVPARQPARRARLRMQPLAADNFTFFVYVCVALLLAGEVVSLFWLDLFA